MKAIERDVDFVGAAIMAGNYRVASEGQGSGVVMGYFHKKSRHDVRYKHAKSGLLPCHLCPYPDIVIGI